MFKKKRAAGVVSGAAAGEPTAKQKRAQQAVVVKELEELAQRIQAEFANYKKRVAAEQEEFVRFAGSQVLLALLPALNNLDRALGHLPPALTDDPWAKGVGQGHKELLASLQKLGLQKIAATGGLPYNPAYHEAVLQTTGPKDVILAELESGYLLHGKVLRPAKVQVGDGTASETSKTTGSQTQSTSKTNDPTGATTT